MENEVETTRSFLPNYSAISSRRTAFNLSFAGRRDDVRSAEGGIRVRMDIAVGHRVQNAA